MKVIWEQRPCQRPVQNCAKNRFQATNVIVTLLVVIEDFAALGYTSNGLVKGTGSVNFWIGGV
ncbi:MAG: hypothetical protein WBM78_03430 [Desulfobacterales bacterium]